MEHNAGRWVHNLGHEEILLPADNAKRRLSDLDFHGVWILIIPKTILCETEARGTQSDNLPVRDRSVRPVIKLPIEDGLGHFAD